MGVADIYRMFFKTPGEVAAALRGWDDRMRGAPPGIETSSAYRRGYWDCDDYLCCLDDVRRERAEARRDE